MTDKGQAWCVEAPELQVATKKPHNVSERLNSKARRRRRSPPVLAVKAGRADRRRMRRLHDKQQRAKRDDSCTKVKQHQTLLQRQRTELAFSLSSQLDSAAQRRQQLLEQKRTKCVKHLTKAQEVRQHNRDAEEEFRAHSAQRLLHKAKIARRLRASKHAAATRIQQWYRVQTLVQACKQLQGTAILTTGSASDESDEESTATVPSFETVTREIQDEHVLQAVMHILHVLTLPKAKAAIQAQRAKTCDNAPSTVKSDADDQEASASRKRTAASHTSTREDGDHSGGGCGGGRHGGPGNEAKTGRIAAGSGASNTAPGVAATVPATGSPARKTTKSQASDVVAGPRSSSTSTGTRKTKARNGAATPTLSPERQKRLQRQSRIVLSAFLIKYHREEIMSGDDAIGHHLADCASTLVAAFRRWVQDVVAAGHRVRRYAHIADSELTRAIRHHVLAFQAWKSKDLGALAQSLVDHYKELLSLKASVSCHKRTRSEWHPHIDQQLQMIETRMRSLGDTERLQECLEAKATFTRRREERKRAAERAKATVCGTRSMRDTMPTARTGRQQQQQQQRGESSDDTSPSPSSPPSSSKRSDAAPSSPAPAPAQPKEKEAEKHSEVQAEEPRKEGKGEADDADVAMARKLAASWDVDLLHNVCVDPTYRLTGARELRFYNEDYDPQPPHEYMHAPSFPDTPPRTATPGAGTTAAGAGTQAQRDMAHLRRRVDHVSRKALMDQLQEELEASPTPGMQRWVPVLRDLTHRLCAVTLPRQQRLRDAIGEELDAERVAAALRDGVMTMSGVRQVVLRYIKMLAAPSRDPRVAQLEASESTAAFLFNAFALLEAMQLDLANYILETYRPLILKYGAQVERDRVQSLVFSGNLTFDNTEAWLKDTVRRAEARAREPYVAATTSTLETPAEALQKMTFSEHFFVATERLLFSSEIDNAFPETLATDRGLLQDARRRLSAIAHTCALYTLLSHKIPRIKRDPDVAKEFRATMLNGFMSEGWLEDLGAAAAQRRMATFAISAINRRLEDKLTQEEEDRVRGVQFGPGAPVLSLLQKRVRDEYRRVIRTQRPSAADLRSNNGLDLCAPQLLGVFVQLARALDHNRHVYAAVYDGIIAAALRDGSSDGDEERGGQASK